jgi:outer membrane protein assembly complex protein YaeT
MVFRAVFLFILVVYSYSQVEASERYQIKTSNEELSKTIEKLVNLDIKRSREDLITDLESTLKSYGYVFSQVKLDKDSIFILNPISWDFFFEGNEHFSDRFLKNALKNSNLNENTEVLVPQLEQNLIKIYKRSGFHFVRVSVKVRFSKDQTRAHVNFYIKENNLVKIDKIKFSGEFPDFTKKELLRKVKKYSTRNIGKGVYSESALNSGLTSLKNDFYNLGYFNAFVNLENIKFNRQKNSVSIFIKVYTNSPTQVTKVDFIGNKEVSDFWLSELLNIRKGEVLNLNRLEEGLNLIEDYYLQRGFLRVYVEKDQILKYSTDFKTARISISITENEQTLVSSIKIRGNAKTKKSIILRELDFKAGEVLTADKISSSTASLSRLGFFSNIKILPLFKKFDALKGTPVEVIISERKSGVFTAGFSLSSELGFTAKTFAGLEYKNIRGTARDFLSRVELQRNLQDINYLENRVFMSYTEPYLFESDIKGRVNITRNDEIWDINAEDNVTLIESNRIDFIMEKQLNSHTTLFLSPFSLDLRGERVFDRSITTKQPNSDIAEVISSVGSTLQFDFRNNPFIPTKGSLSRVQMEYATPLLGSRTRSALDNSKNFELEYLKVQGSYSFYRSVSSSLIWAQSFRGGYLRNYSETGSNGVSPFPKSRAFFLGGSTTIRGFDPSRANERIPNDQYLDENGGLFDGNTIGGGVLNIPEASYYYLTKTELRFPLSKDSSWWGAIFYDGGSVQITELSRDYDKWRHAVGIGFRFNTPLGPLLNAEVAYKLDRNNEIDESAIQFHLSVSSF